MINLYVKVSASHHTKRVFLKIHCTAQFGTRAGRESATPPSSLLPRQRDVARGMTRVQQRRVMGILIQSKALSVVASHLSLLSRSGHAGRGGWSGAHKRICRVFAASTTLQRWFTTYVDGHHATSWARCQPPRVGEVYKMKILLLKGFGILAYLRPLHTRVLASL